MKCPHCESKEVTKIGYDIFDDLFFCDACDEEFETDRDKTTDPKHWSE